MTESRTTFATDRTDYEARSEAGERVILAPALHLRSEVRKLSEFYRGLAAEAEGINVINTPYALAKLRRLRTLHRSREAEARAKLLDVIDRVGEPVEGSTSLELAWVQGFTLAAGLSAHANLQGALSAASEALDRKSAYSIACFSLYVAAVSLVATLVLGVMSLK